MAKQSIAELRRQVGGQIFSEPLPPRTALHHLEAMLQRMIEALDRLTEQTRLNNQLIDELKAATLALGDARREIDRLREIKNENRARKRRNAW